VRKFLGRKSRPSLDELDQAVLEQMRSLGWDMSEERLIENFLYFPTLEAAERAGDELRGLGYDAKVGPGADGENWLVQANVRRVVEIEVIRAQRSELTSLASAGGGEYDGWGVGK
jgi:regulator of RNase E activity RraB